MTKYRIEPSYNCNLLQYQKERSFLWFKYSTWENIPMIKNIWDRHDSTFVEDYKKYVSDYDEDLDKFIEKWPIIENYFIYFKFMKDSYEINYKND